MSEKNREGKRAARERLREQRERDRTREKRKRGLLVGVAAVAVLGIATAVGLVVSQSKKGQESGPVVAPSGAQGQDALAIPVGEAGARSTLTVYEDFRCPACGQFENTFRPTLHELVGKDQLKIDYHLVTIIDGNLGGSGSRNAANAAACAQDAGKFWPYHDVLYQNQPLETNDAFANKDLLIKLAGKVPGLATSGFRTCVQDGRHDNWVKKSNNAFTNSGHQGTPTVLLNGKDVYSNQQQPLTPAKLKKLVAKQ